MKKEEHGDFEYVKLEEDDDIELFRKTFGLVLYQVENGFICVNYNEGFAFKFELDKKEWALMDYKKLPNLEDSLDDVEATEVYKKYPPFDAIDKYKEDKANKKLAYWAEQRKNTKRKVIGWMPTYDNPLIGRQTDEKIAALINDIAEHDYFFGGDDIDLVPIFDDKTCLDFSSSGWGEIEALANNMGDDFAYSMYKNACMLVPPFRMPKEGYYKK